MAGTTKLLTSGGGGVSITPDASIASDITVKVPTSGVNNGTLVCSDSSGNVGIGTSSPTSKLVVSGGGAAIQGNSIPSTGAGLEFYTDGSTGTGLNGSWIQSYSRTSSAWMQTNYNALAHIFSTSSAERMRIDSSGNLLVNTTDTTLYNNTSGNGVCYRVNASLDVATSSDNCMILNRMTSVGGIAEFRYAGSIVGSVSTNGTSTAYNTSSDYRLKENIQPMQNALGVVAQLNPVTYTWKADGSDGQGFIAHELQAVVPDCVTGEKDAVDEEGNPVYQGIDTSFLVATLTKAIQELSAKNDALEARIATLEAK